MCLSQLVQSAGGRDGKIRLDILLTVRGSGKRGWGRGVNNNDFLLKLLVNADKRFYDVFEKTNKMPFIALTKGCFSEQNLTATNLLDASHFYTV